jgi:protein-L-isoaspartate(D-aspartate) O-methyltransferase
MSLAETLKISGYLKTPLIIEAFKAIRRVDFLPADLVVSSMPELSLKELAELDTALPIGYGQTISQPSVVAFMLELLQPEPGHKILDIGFGSGWTTALLSHIVGQKSGGKVVAVERIEKLRNFGESNFLKYNFKRKDIAEFIFGDASLGLADYSPYDRILASASTDEIPNAWIEQLKPNGRLVASRGFSILQIIKDCKGGIKSIEYPGFVFVPLLKDTG